VIEGGIQPVERPADVIDIRAHPELVVELHVATQEVEALLVVRGDDKFVGGRTQTLQTTTDERHATKGDERLGAPHPL
jgi:hypothetical protein